MLNTATTSGPYSSAVTGSGVWCVEASIEVRMADRVGVDQAEGEAAMNGYFSPLDEFFDGRRNVVQVVCI